MKTTCPYCKTDSVFYRAEKLTDTESSLDLQCADIKACGARTTYTLSVKKLLQPSRLPIDKQNPNPNGLLSSRQRIHCSCCGQPAVIYARYNPTHITSDFYTQCQNPACQARVLVDLSYQSTELPPITNVQLMAVQIIRTTPPKRRAELQLDLLAMAG
ncbi:hypothetical protein [Methylovulum psychrotolerans]|uniref:Zinc finger Ogr/Delta-type domain-containing protein n=1 Tax=Methylovulum psychrotolerans TaxID=1704499 RepID=A0A2S5CGF5_9GAMM|nr:hypothetical protein [Methylovulum psychrotolerans]POZ49888.1 hypothetical protein AADEFJLK_04334 [Methylovulum psychrotolerans]